MFRRSVTLLVVALSAGSLAFADGGTVLVPSESKLFMRNSGTGTAPCPGEKYLNLEAGPATEPGCGYQGGAPFRELTHTTGGVIGSSSNVYTTDDTVPVQTLDASRNLKGNNRVVSTSQTQRNAVGQIRVDVVVRGETAAGTIVLGSATSELIVYPTTSAEMDFPFDINVNDALSGTKFLKVTVDVDIRGWHVLSGYHRLSGQSWMTLPTLVEAAPAP